MTTMAGVARVSATLACVLGLVGASAAGAAKPSKVVPARAKVVAKIAIPAGTGGIAVGEGAVWALSWSSWTLMRIDPHGNAIRGRTQVKPTRACPPAPDTCGQVAAGNGAVWVSMRTDNTVARVDPRTGSVTAKIPVGAEPDGIAAAPGAIWVVNHGFPSASGAPSVSRIDAATNQVVATIPVGPYDACCSDHMAVAVSAGAVWVTVPNLGAVVRIDPATNAVVATIRMAGTDKPCGHIAVAKDVVWTTSAHCPGGIMRIDPATNKPAGKLTGSTSPINAGVAFGSLWVTDLDAKAVERFDLRTRRMVGRLPVEGIPVLLVTGFGAVSGCGTTRAASCASPRGTERNRGPREARSGCSGLSHVPGGTRPRPRRPRRARRGRTACPASTRPPPRSGTPHREREGDDRPVCERAEISCREELLPVKCAAWSGGEPAEDVRPEQLAHGVVPQERGEQRPTGGRWEIAGASAAGTPCATSPSCRCPGGRRSPTIMSGRRPDREHARRVHERGQHPCAGSALAGRDGVHDPRAVRRGEKADPDAVEDEDAANHT